MLLAFRAFMSNMDIKLNFLSSHLDQFHKNPEAVSEEQGDRFYQDLKIMEELNLGRWDTDMMADYCCSTKRDCPN